MGKEADLHDLAKDMEDQVMRLLDPWGVRVGNAQADVAKGGHPGSVSPGEPDGRQPLAVGSIQGLQDVFIQRAGIALPA